MSWQRIRANKVLGEKRDQVGESGAWLLTAASGEFSRIDPQTIEVAATRSPTAPPS